MQLSKLMGGDTPYITNLAVYSASAIDIGSVLIADAGSATTNVAHTVSTVSTTAAADNFTGITTISSQQAVASKENLALGGQSFNIDTDYIPNRGISTGGTDWLPAVVSPGAIYFGRYSATTGAGTVGVNVYDLTASATTNVVGVFLGNQQLVGCWIYSLADVSSGTATFSGQVRQISNSAATTSLTMVSAWQVSTDTEAIMTYAYNTLGVNFDNVDGTGRALLGSRVTGGAAGASRADGLQAKVLASSIQHDAAPMHRLTQRVDDGLDGVTGGKVYSEIVFTDNAWNGVT